MHEGDELCPGIPDDLTATHHSIHTIYLTKDVLMVDYVEDLPLPNLQHDPMNAGNTTDTSSCQFIHDTDSTFPSVMDVGTEIQNDLKIEPAE